MGTACTPHSLTDTRTVHQLSHDQQTNSDITSEVTKILISEYSTVPNSATVSVAQKLPRKSLPPEKLT